MTKKQQAVTKSEDVAEMAIIPGQIEGMEGIEQDMLLIPRIKLIQALSPEVMDHGFTPGSFADSVMFAEIAKNKGKEGAAINIIPVKVSGRSRIKFESLEEGGGILCSAPDGKIGNGDPGGHCLSCAHSKWSEVGGKNTAPPCTEFYNMFVMVEGYDSSTPLVLSFSKTTLKAGRQLINFIYSKQVSPWKFKYELKSKYVEEGEMKYFTLTVKPSGVASDDQQGEAASFYNILKAVDHIVDDSAGKDEEPAPF